MKNIRIKILLLLTLLFTIFSVLTWFENAKTIDIVISKNFSDQRIKLSKVLRIQDEETREMEGEKFVVNLEEKYINDQNTRGTVFDFSSLAVLFSLACLVIGFIELKKRS